GAPACLTAPCRRGTGPRRWPGRVRFVLVCACIDCARRTQRSQTARTKVVTRGGAAMTAHLPSRASLIDGNGTSLQPLTMAGDAVQVEYSAGETIRTLLGWE